MAKGWEEERARKWEAIQRERHPERFGKKLTLAEKWAYVDAKSGKSAGECLEIAAKGAVGYILKRYGARLPKELDRDELYSRAVVYAVEFYARRAELPGVLLAYAKDATLYELRKEIARASEKRERERATLAELKKRVAELRDATAEDVEELEQEGIRRRVRDVIDATLDAFDVAGTNRREIVRAVCIEGRSQSEAARAVGIKPQRAQQIITKFKARFRDKWRELSAKGL